MAMNDGPDYSFDPEQYRSIMRLLNGGSDIEPVEPPAPPAYKRSSFWENAAGPAAQVLGSFAPAVLPGRGHATANVLSALGQIAGGAIENRVKDRRLDYVGRQKQYEAKRAEYDERQKAAKRLHELAGMQVIQGRKATVDEPKEDNAYKDITDDLEAQKALKSRGAIIPPKNSKGRIMVPSSFFGPREQKEPKPVVDPESLTELVETNTDGYKYINMAHLVGKSPEFRQAVYAAAKNNGAVMLTKEQADAVSNVDVAMMNVGQLERDIAGLLPKDANGRLIGSPKNKLRAYFQTSDDLAAWGANRNRAIQILRAAAGSHGLRINEAEILYSVENDIPKIDDTEATALKKLARVREQLKNVSKAILVRDRSSFMKQEKDKRDADSSSVDDEVNSVLKRP